MLLRNHQQDCVFAFYNYYERGNGGHGLIIVPTAGGKSIIIGKLVTEICQKWPGQRILILSHVGELIAQNHEKIKLCWPGAPAGIYSASLGQRKAHLDIVTATIQSVYQKAEMLGHRDLCFVDECHLMAGQATGMYGKLIAALIAINPAMKICGFSATPYRLDRGMLTEGEGALFDDIIIDIPIMHLLEEGYLTPPVTKSSLVQADLVGVKRTAGEFNIKQMGERFDQKAFINAALDDDAPHLAGRKSIAVFCATLENATHVADGMITRGIPCETLDGKMSKEDRADRLERFRSGELRALASVGVMTTGVDVPNIDAMLLFRATESPGLYQQIIGRGFRVMYAPGHELSTKDGRLAAIANGVKPDFLVRDHGGNVERHGPITHVERPRKKEKGQRAPAAKLKVRICEICRSGWPLDARTCQTCGAPLVVERDPTAGLSIEASSADILGSAFLRGEQAMWFDIDDIKYSRHVKQETGGESLRITYHCGVMQFDEWAILPNIKKVWFGYAPLTIQDAVTRAAECLHEPKRIQVAKKGKFYNIIRKDFIMEVVHANTI